MQTWKEASSIWDRLAHICSEVLNPFYLAIPTFFVISLYSAPDVLHALLWWLITILGISIIPLTFILHGVRRGRFSDHHVSRREQRMMPLVFGIMCMLISFGCLFLLKVSMLLIVTVLAVIIACLITLIITTRWKLSIHLVGVTGMVTVFVLLFGPLYFLLAPLVPLVAWARWKVRAHTPLQALAGMVLAVTVTVLLFWAFGLVHWQ